MALCYQQTDCSLPSELNFPQFHYTLMRFFPLFLANLLAWASSLYAQVQCSNTYTHTKRQFFLFAGAKSNEQ